MDEEKQFTHEGKKQKNSSIFGASVSRSTDIGGSKLMRDEQNRAYSHVQLREPTNRFRGHIYGKKTDVINGIGEIRPLYESINVRPRQVNASPQISSLM